MGELKAAGLDEGRRAKVRQLVGDRALLGWLSAGATEPAKKTVDEVYEIWRGGGIVKEGSAVFTRARARESSPLRDTEERLEDLSKSFEGDVNNGGWCG